MLSFRALTANDQKKLWHWLHVALWDPPPAGLRPVEVLQMPDIRIYAEHWGRQSDVGIVAQVNEIDAGACWMRLLPRGTDLTFANTKTPRLGIALEPEYRRKGIGHQLMQAALDAAQAAGYTQVSLTVHRENSAVHMYKRFGFQTINFRNNYHLMVTNLTKFQPYKVL